MNIKALSDPIILPTRKDVLRIQLYTKLIEFGIKPFENDIDIILELYMFGGYHNSEEQARFINLCIEKKLKKTDQSVRNTLSKYVTRGVFDKPKNTILYLNDKYIPHIECEQLVLLHRISHAE